MPFHPDVEAARSDPAVTLAMRRERATGTATGPPVQVPALAAVVLTDVDLLEILSELESVRPDVGDERSQDSVDAVLALAGELLERWL